MFDIHQKIDNEYGEPDEAAGEEYIAGLLNEFADSPEGKAIIEAYGDIGWSGSMMDLGINYLGCTPATMTVQDFNEVVFQLIPRKVTTEPETAGDIIDELGGFWTFVVRQYRLDNAQRILKTLDEDAASRLQRALADPRNWGLAKSFFMQGKKSGFDMTTQEGLDAFTQFHNSSLGGLPPLPDFDAEDYPADFVVGGFLPLGPSKKEKDKKKKKRKAERQARKRNRKR
jgi:hypothetical protein